MPAASIARLTAVFLLGTLATPLAAQEIGDAVQGRVFATDICAECHAVLPGEATSPNPRATPFETVANTPGMTSIALTAWLQSSHPTMPNIKLSDTDMKNVIAHILSLKKE